MSKEGLGYFRLIKFTYSFSNVFVGGLVNMHLLVFLKAFVHYHYLVLSNECLKHIGYRLKFFLNDMRHF
jgi:hypothetical protein